MRKLFTLAICGLSLLALSSTAQAVPITGEIHFVGLWQPTGGTGIGDATGLSFPDTAFGPFVAAGTDTYAGLTGTVVSFQDFTFSPVMSPDPVSPLWVLSSGGVGYAFELQSVAVSFQSATQLNLIGSGVLHADGFDDTPANWDFTGNQGSVLFSFSADNVAVPEPTTVGLFALGLVGLTAAGNKRARRIA